MISPADELWAVTRGGSFVDADALSRAVEKACDTDASSLDYRTRLLVRDSLRALTARWGDERLRLWLNSSPRRIEIERARDPAFFDPDPAEIGFPSLERRVVNAITPETINRFFRDLSLRVSRPTRLVIGGSIPLMLAGHLARHTEDVDVVDELPAELRGQHDVLNELSDRYGLRLAHFQSHYLPSGWEARLRSFAVFEKLEVFLVDPYDIFVGKLFSNRAKDRQDLNDLTSGLDRSVIVGRLRESTASFRSDARLLDAAKQNWFVLFGEQLPA